MSLYINSVFLSFSIFLTLNNLDVSPKYTAFLHLHVISRMILRLSEWLFFSSLILVPGMHEDEVFIVQDYVYTTPTRNNAQPVEFSNEYVR